MKSKLSYVRSCSPPVAIEIRFWDPRLCSKRASIRSVMTVSINGFLALQTSSSVWLGGKKLKETRIHYVIPVKVDAPGFETLQGLEMFFFSKTSRPALGPTQGYRGSFAEKKQPGREVDH